MPKFNPNDANDLHRLKRAVDWSQDKLEPFRKRRLELVRQYVGFHYSDDGSHDRVPMPYIQMALDIYLRHLVAKNPRALVSTRPKELKRAASLLELAINFLTEAIRLEDTLRRWAQEALFSVGVLKVGMNIRAPEAEGYLHDRGQPFADLVTLDDFIVDMSARTMEQVQFIGNSYRLPLDWVKDSDLYETGPRDDLVADEKLARHEDGTERAEVVSQGDSPVMDDYYDTVDLIDLWLPLDGMVVTLPLMQNWVGALRTVKWSGPEHGPYHMLGFSTVPGSVMPFPPAALLRDVHELSNTLFNKMGRQAERAKTVFGVRAGGTQEGERVINAPDGTLYRMDDPNAIKEMKFPGVDGNTLAFTMQLRELFTWIGGNIDLLGGLGPQADTLGQEQMLTQTASQRVADMQARMGTATRRVLKDLAWYLWNDPKINLPLTKRVGGQEFATRFTPRDRDGEFLDYNVDIQPYSMQDQPPGLKLQTITNFFSTFVIPALPLLQQSGVSVNWDNLLRTVARLSNIKEIEDLLTFSSPSLSPDDSPITARQSPQTTRTNVRINRAGTTRQGAERNLVSQLLTQAQ